MKSAIIYYSYSGNTRKAALLLSEYLKSKGEVEILELKALDESGNFLGQCQRAFRHKKANLAAINFDLSNCDLVCFGTPVWAFGPAPAMNAYLDQLQGCENKEAVVFTTYGSGTGNDRCLNYMQTILTQKGITNFKKFSVQQFKVNDKEFVSAKIKEAID